MAAGRVPVIGIVTPYLAQANNGNWRTARRWAVFLRDSFRVILQARWTPDAPGSDADLLVVLHARRSATSVAAFKSRHPDRPLLLCLTGTDLYRDVPQGDGEALASIAVADRLVVLQEDALRHLDADARARATVVFQSARRLRAQRKPHDRLDLVVVGHLRPEKDPLTALAALGAVPRELPVRLTHIGEALDPGLGRAVAEFAARDPRYRWLGGLPHGVTRQAIRRAHLLVHPSLMEGGANVIVEAITAGTAVLASRMSGNVGMLGEDYPGYFPVGDAAALAGLIERAVGDRAFLRTLDRQCARRRPLFAPERERRLVVGAVRALLRRFSAPRTR